MAERTIPPRPTALDDEFTRLTVDTNTLVANLSGYADKVGIGTVTPAHTLVVSANTGEEGLQVNGARNQYAGSIRSSTVTGEAYGPYFRGGSNSSDIALAVDNADGTSNYFKIRGDGNVGVGASDPDQALEVGGVIHVSSEVASPSAPSGGDGGNIYVKSDGRLYYLSDTVSETDLSSGGGSGTVTSITPAADSGSGSAITSSGTFTYTGGTNVTTAVSGTTVTINSTDQYSGTVTSITPAADAGSGTAITSSGTLTVSGTSNEVDTSVSGTTITVGLPTNVSIAGTLGTGDAVTASKAVNSDLTALVITNNDATADAAGMVSIQFNLNDIDDDQNLPAGKIQVSKEATWTSDDNTHDAQMRFELAENGTQAEVMTISSGGNLTIDGDLNLGTDQIKDSGTNVMLASDGSGNVTLAAASKTISLAGFAIHSQGIRQAMSQISAVGPTSLNTGYTWVDVNCSSNTVNLNLPTASSAGPGFVLYIQDFSGTINSGASRTCVINRAGTDTIGGSATSKTISNPAGKLWLISNGTNGWGVIDEEGT